ncbi:hypothetical protein XCCB100_0432 [Xanthomonas campestris pv. campestris]|uniref:Uncharacterized protein n=1 Tax=Xanthomonas campestris pv. campestris (strain B100) TaxID=509169 RepID=B0RMS8_XANCB|nr:hypothetical protein XCCB100_0432 [Xanthomonas campestris pv. campestris]
MRSARNGKQLGTAAVTRQQASSPVSTPWRAWASSPPPHGSPTPANQRMNVGAGLSPRANSWLSQNRITAAADAADDREGDSYADPDPDRQPRAA